MCIGIHCCEISPVQISLHETHGEIQVNENVHEYFHLAKLILYNVAVSCSNVELTLHAEQ